MGTIYALDTEAFKFSEESKKQDKSICKEEYIKTYCMPEKIIFSFLYSLVSSSLVTIIFFVNIFLFLHTLTSTLWPMGVSATIFGKRKASTDLKTSLNDALREHSVAV